MDLPRFAIVRKNDELDYWELMAMNDLMRYEQARDELKRLRGKGYQECYLVAVTFIAGPSTDVEA